MAGQLPCQSVARHRFARREIPAVDVVDAVLALSDVALRLSYLAVEAAVERVEVRPLGRACERQQREGGLKEGLFHHWQ